MTQGGLAAIYHDTSRAVSVGDSFKGIVHLEIKLNSLIIDIYVQLFVV